MQDISSGGKTSAEKFSCGSGDSIDRLQLSLERLTLGYFRKV